MLKARVPFLGKRHSNCDGPAENYSWNCGWEGDENPPPEVLPLRKRQAKNFCALLLLSNGTPMLRAGDEFLNSQESNNNPYNQDNPTGWVDWSGLGAPSRRLSLLFANDCLSEGAPEPRP